MSPPLFEWDWDKDRQNQAKHGVSFETARLAFLDRDRVLVEDERHSSEEDRLFCVGRVGDGILAVRFTHRGDRIRIIGAGYWRKWRALYEKKNRLHG